MLAWKFLMTVLIKWNTSVSQMAAYDLDLQWVTRPFLSTGSKRKLIREKNELENVPFSSCLGRPDFICMQEMQSQAKSSFPYL